MKLKEIREMYPEGTQIVLTEMAGESQMPYGLKGTVKFVDDAGQIHMSWENGSSLALNIHEDTFEKVEAPEKISVILVEPGRYPKLIEIEDTLEAMQSLVEGFVCWVYTASGVHNLPRTTAQGIYNQCAIISPSEAKPGDIIFFTGTYDSPGPVSHVGIYVGDGMMLHCGSPIQYANINSSYWQTHFYAFGRL